MGHFIGLLISDLTGPLILSNTFTGNTDLTESNFISVQHYTVLRTYMILISALSSIIAPVNCVTVLRANGIPA